MSFASHLQTNQNAAAPGSATYCFLLPPLSQASAKQIVLRIGEIFGKHAQNQEYDYLSEDLSQWGVEVISKWKTVHKTQQAIQNLIEVSFNQLNNILIDPIFREPLKSPVLVRKWTWEKSRLDEYTKPPFDKNPFCPFDGKPIDIIKPHALAIDMLKLLHEIRPTEPAPPTEKLESKKIHTLKDIQQTHQMADFGVWMMTLKLAKETADLQFEKEKQKRAKELELFAVELGKEFDQRLDIAAKDFKEELSKDKQHFDQRLTHLETTYKDIDTQRVKQLDANKQQLQRAEARVVTLKDEVVEERRENQRLRQQMSALQHSFQQAINNSNDSGCIIS
jgi:hypothetical protein